MGSAHRRGNGEPDNRVGGKRGCRTSGKGQISAPDPADAVGHDEGKKVKGRKVHALVDILGLAIRLVADSTIVQDRDGAALLLHKDRQRFS